MCPIAPLANHTLHGGCVCTGNVWQQHEDTSSGHAFYYCAATGETRWTPPEGDELLLDAMTGKVVGGGKLLSGDDAEAAKTAAATAGTSTARGTRPPTHRRSSITLTAHNVSNHSHASFVVVVVVGVPWGSPRVLLCAQIWNQVFDMDSLRMYWYNNVTGETSWDRPAVLCLCHAAQLYSNL